MTKEETKFGSYFKLPNPNLRAYFGRVVQGQPDEYRTPFYKGKSLQDILRGWKKILESCPAVTRYQSLLDFENDLAKKVGPLSIMKPLRDRMKDIDSYYDDVLLPSKPIEPRAIVATQAEWSKFGGLRLRSVPHTVDEMKKSTNSGSPFFEVRREALKRTLPISDTYLIGEPYRPDIVQVLQGRKWNACAVLGWRGQEGGPNRDDVKQRVVWMFPVGVNIEELRAYQPLVAALQQPGGVPAWVSTDAVDRAITRLFDTKSPDDLVVATDFSKFDQHFNKHLSDAALEILDSLFTGDPSWKWWMNHVYPIKYAIPLAYNWGMVRTGLHGMGSGSGGTNQDETLAHRAMQHEVALRHGQTLNPNSQCLGDDGILSYPGITVRDVVDSYVTHGQVCNEEKFYASTTDTVYLRRWHHVDYRQDGVCVGVYSTYRALGRLAEQERYYDPEIWGPKAVAIRQLSIIENCCYHPAREEFADYCMRGDKYRLGIDIPGFLDNIADEAKKLVDHMPDFLGYTKSLSFKDKDAAGIKDWWIVKYLKSKSRA